MRRPNRLLVVLLHGIRTEGAWQEGVAVALRENAAQPIPIKYGFLDLFRFLIPGLREGSVRRVYNQLMIIKHRNPGSDIVVVAHSFGTYIITRLLRAHPHLRLKRLALCGSIVPRDFEWAQIQERVEEEVLNDCGTHDILPVLAQAVTWGYGASGTFGFGAYGVRDRFHKFSHSEFFNPVFSKKFLLPYVLHGKIVESIGDIRPSPPWWQSALAVFPVRYLIVAALAVSIVSLVLGTRGSTTAVEPPPPYAPVMEVRIAGQVLIWPSSRPIEGASVRFATDQHSDSTRTAADGRFSLVLPGTAVRRPAVVSIEKIGYAPFSQSIMLSGPTYFTVPLRPSVTHTDDRTIGLEDPVEKAQQR